ncbi:MAG: NADH-quinone oxidoreductase subunit B family protein [Dehalococcoidia bacterium]
MTAPTQEPPGVPAETRAAEAPQAGNVTGAPLDTMDKLGPLTMPQPHPAESMGPLEKVYAFWLAGMSCDGCSISVLGATAPPVESLLTGTIPGVPRVILHHPVLSVEAGEAFVNNYRLAMDGKLDAPYVVILEGSVPDESLSGDGYWSAMGTSAIGGSDGGKPEPVATWLARLAPGAAATIAIGTCATWGGIPAAAGNPTGAMSLMDFLGRDYRSAFGLPVINVPGCAPVGDNFTETVAAVLLFLQGIGPLPEFDELGRPAWLFSETVHRRCTRAGYYEEGTFASEYGEPQCLVEIGCWGPVVQCNITSRGAINHMGGCMNTGGICIGCTMPGFPDKFAPFYKTPPGSAVSSNTSRTVGSGIRALRRISQRDRNRETRWDRQGSVPSGWADVDELGLTDRVMHYFYEKLQFWHSERPGLGRHEEKSRGDYEVPAEWLRRNKP